jgi:hypothetical protein
MVPSSGILARVNRARLLAGLALALAAPATARAEAILQGPYPFLKENELSLQTGWGVGNGFHGAHAGVNYAYQAAGSLWFDLRIGLVDGPAVPAGAPPCTATPSATMPMPCAGVDTYADVLAGIKYKLRTSIPLVPYVGVVAGPLYLFNRGADGAFGFAARGSIGATYFLYEWLGFTLEMATTLGSASVPEAAGLDGGLRFLEWSGGVELQF